MEIKKQRNSDKLHKGYQRAGSEWNEGRNNNPGAKRDSPRRQSRSRSRSRSKDKQNRQKEGEINDNASNYSFILCKSQRDLNFLRDAFEGMELEEEKSLIMEGKERKYNWGGKETNPQRIGSWSYTKYMK